MRWWAWYCGRTQYPSIFAFLVFPLWCWLTMMHRTNVMLHAIVCGLNARFSLSLYCSRHLYSVTSRRGSNDQWLSRSLKQAGQILIAPPRNTCLSRFTFWSFSTLSRHVQHGLGQAHLVIGFIALLGTQVRQLVIFKLLQPVSFYF